LSQLQTTLDAVQVMRLFADECRKVMPYDSFSYRNDADGLVLDMGRAARHSCTYRLVVAEDVLGQLTLTRAGKFHEDETVELEYLLVSLVYPLRNALLYQRAQQSALRDALTGLHNRAAMDEALRREFHLARRNRSVLSLAVLDIDHFKSINDTYGHAAGDEVLKAVARTIADSIRATDILARYGGEEFCLLLSNTDRAGAAIIAERVREAVAKAVCQVKGAAIHFTLSVGVATLGPQGDEQTLFEQADAALYGAKHAGRNRVCLAAGE
jgi:diguanylate cyclase (GGDEF)-like protein